MRRISQLYNHHSDMFLARLGKPRPIIRLWGGDDIAQLPLGTRLDRIAFIQKYIMDSSSQIADADLKNYINISFPDSIDQGVKLLDSLDYSPDLHRMFDWIADDVCERFGVNSNIKKVSRYYNHTGFDKEARRLFLQMMADEMIESAQHVVPALKPVRISFMNEDEPDQGYLTVRKNNITSKDFDDLYFHPRRPGLALDINLLAHEMVHQIMLQMMVLHVHKDAFFPESIGADLDMKKSQIEKRATGRSSILLMYKADPEERLSNRIGYFIQSTFCAEHNLGDLRLSREIVKSLEPMFEAYSRDRPLPPIP